MFFKDILVRVCHQEFATHTFLLHFPNPPFELSLLGALMII
jgi:hypothetical protein